jgi:4-diphosphocytidyl-2-C-methyl-D-erythritol kinase
MQQPTTITLQAYAKINLGLHILRKRADGYHDIETVFHRVNLFDSVTVERSTNEGIAIRCTHPEIPTDENNLCYKGAKLFYSEIDHLPDLSITIEKDIPVGAGLGGGSSDAAAILQACNMLYGYPLGDDTLGVIASRIGSDVPYFLQPGSAYATGRGEVLDYFHLELPYWIVLIYPRIHIDTKWAYQSSTPNHSLKKIAMKSLVQDNLLQPRTWVNALRNDFEPVVFGKFPVILRVKEALLKAGADFALLSGSGSSVFGLYQDEIYAREIAESLSSTYNVWITPPFFVPEPMTPERKADE